MLHHTGPQNDTLGHPWPCACSWVSQEARKHPSPKGSAGALRKQRDGRRDRLSLQIATELHVGCPAREGGPPGLSHVPATPELLQGALLQPRAPSRCSSSSPELLQGALLQPRTPSRCSPPAQSSCKVPSSSPELLQGALLQPRAPARCPPPAQSSFKVLSSSPELLQGALLQPRAPARCSPPAQNSFKVPSSSPKLLQGALLQPRTPSRCSPPAQKAFTWQQRSVHSAPDINEKLNAPHITLVFGPFSGCFLFSDYLRVGLTTASSQCLHCKLRTTCFASYFKGNPFHPKSKAECLLWRPSPRPSPTASRCRPNGESSAPSAGFST
ncbi:uncharacterized protein LOC134521351 isoform X2 [Chroicocephalus ridibundus]|uniref:uncharacterized protein LOC134521351 isoform X2 n=1 Tax=Chroicocephalus ridibundus TaxID=1192867 RepID=UPI002FDDDD0F